jgi:hypothetical protein
MTMTRRSKDTAAAFLYPRASSVADRLPTYGAVGESEHLEGRLVTLRRKQVLLSLGA